MARAAGNVDRMMIGMQILLGKEHESEQKVKE